MSAEFDNLIQEVSDCTDVERAVTTAFQWTAAQLQMADANPSRLKALYQDLVTNTPRLAQAIVANTPAATAASTR